MASPSEARRLWIARVARRFGCTMADVRAMTLADVAAMDKVLREEAADAQRRAQAYKARGKRRG